MSTADNLWKQFRPGKMFSWECLHVQTRISLRCSRKKCSVSFSAPICVLNHLLLVSSTDNLFKQLGPRADPAKLSCENGAHVKSGMSLRCWRGKFFLFLSAHFCFLLVPFFLQSSIQFCWNSCFSSVCSCENAHMSLRCSRGFFIHFWVDLLCFCSVLCLLCFVRVCLYVLRGHLLGKGWPLGSRLWCLLWVCHFPIGILGQVWYLIVSIPDLCNLTYFELPCTQDEFLHDATWWNFVHAIK